MQERFEVFTVLINRISRNIRKIKKGKACEKMSDLEMLDVEFKT